MSLSEFSLIDDYIAISRTRRPDVSIGIGDDCAILEVPPGKSLAVSMDTLVSGRHFIEGVNAVSLGHKALAVNLSDLAAMGAEPAWATLSLTMPEADIRWIRDFMQGFLALADRFGVQLVGGDTSRGPLSITVQIHGFVDPRLVMRRDAAQPGDLIYVTGSLGDAGLALRLQQAGKLDKSDHQELLRRLDSPIPRINEGMQLASIATAAIDLSDGLISDLGHVVQQSHCGATIELQRLPCSRAVKQAIDESNEWSLPLSSGDDYELCFTVPAEKQPQLQQLAATLDCPLTHIGVIEQQPGIRCVDAEGAEVDVESGYDHFT
ncbi:MAG: thiamine-phosphate kinase [Pseudomonadota bacterium]|nr:thiamine-phosphate kinase [Pseudomonadota bacterium]